MAQCESVHPQQPGVRCILDHQFGDHYDPDTDLFWPGIPMPPRAGRKGAHKRLDDLTVRLGHRPATGVGPPDPKGYYERLAAPVPPEGLRRAEDPPDAHEAIASYEPVRSTALSRTLDYLVARTDQWVNMEVLRSPAVGGSSGDRRARELRKMGHRIGHRRHPEHDNIWQWMYASPEQWILLSPEERGQRETELPAGAGVGSADGASPGAGSAPDR